MTGTAGAGPEQRKLSLRAGKTDFMTILSRASLPLFPRFFPVKGKGSELIRRLRIVKTSGRRFARGLFFPVFLFWLRPVGDPPDRNLYLSGTSFFSIPLSGTHPFDFWSRLRNEGITRLFFFFAKKMTDD